MASNLANEHRNLALDALEELPDIDCEFANTCRAALREITNRAVDRRNNIIGLFRVSMVQTGNSAAIIIILETSLPTIRCFVLPTYYAIDHPKSSYRASHIPLRR